MRVQISRHTYITDWPNKILAMAMEQASSGKKRRKVAACTGPGKRAGSSDFKANFNKTPKK